MSTEFVECAPKTRCYKCGKPNIENICHHCGRPMCSEHSTTVKDENEKLLSTEFSDLGLGDSKCGEEGMHCADCHHIIYAPVDWSINPAAIGTMIVGGVLGAILSDQNLIFGLILGLVVILIGVVIMVVSYQTNKKNNEKIETETLKLLPPLSLLPRFDSLTLRETLCGNITLYSNAGYESEIKPVEGTLSIKASFAKPERDQLEKYLQKYSLSNKKNLPFHAGFALLQGFVGLKFKDNSRNSGSCVISLKGNVHNQPYLSGVDKRGAGDWSIDKKYTVLNTFGDMTLPIRIIPSFVQGAAQRAINLVVQWSPSFPSTSTLQVDRIDLLELNVPISWGEMENATQGALIETLEESEKTTEPLRKISWKRIKIPNSEHFYRKKFKLRFENPIDSNSKIYGRVELLCKGALSHIKRIDIFYPVGKVRQTDVAVVETKVTVEFELSLAGLRYQDVRVVLDKKKESDKNKEDTLVFNGVIPDSSTVVTLTNSMSEQGFYIKRIIENPPRTGGEANLINRYWDIAGRKYTGVYPIDFHLVLTGEELHDNNIRAQAGVTKTILTVRGTYVNQEMEEQIKNVWEQISELIVDTFKKIPKLEPVTPKEKNVHPQPVGEISVVGDEVNVKEVNERFNILNEQLKKLTEAFTAARVFEKTYLEIKKQIEEDLKKLQNNI